MNCEAYLALLISYRILLPSRIGYGLVLTSPLTGSVRFWYARCDRQEVFPGVVLSCSDNDITYIILYKGKLHDQIKV